MNEQSLEQARHSAAHMLAAAVLELYGERVIRGVGPAVENGFYYDFDFGANPPSDKDLKAIEKKMKQLIRKNFAFEGKVVSADEARDAMKGQPLKLELIEDFASENQELSLYTSGPFTDLCRGGHAENTSEINADGLKLQRIAGAYWKGDESKQMLTRIYGFLFASKEELDAHLSMLAEAEKRDHRKLGKELDLFAFSDLVGAGLPLFTPKGTTLIRRISDYLEQLKRSKGYEFVDIPHLAKRSLYETSGHWDKFGEEIFKVSGMSEEFVLKPMNCPHHTQIYASRPRSYRDLPQRYAEITKQYRDEQSGELHGLSRVRSISIDDTHIFCRRDQLLQEAMNAYDIITKFTKTFGLESRVRLSLRDPNNPDGYLGSGELWEEAESKLREVLVQEKRDFIEGIGEAAFYGPKLDFIAKDSIGREWQLSTIQVDFNQPHRFGLTYTDENGADQEAVAIHVAVAGSLERFLSVIIEHFAGAFPFWLSPVQVDILAVGEAHVEYANQLREQFAAAGITAFVDDASETVGKKIRSAVKRKTPYLLVVGDKEVESGILSVRKRGEQDSAEMPVAAFVEHSQKLQQERALGL